jgi:hypothetical protein
LAADGTAATGLTITNFDLQYVRSGAAPSAKVDATALAATDSAHGDNQAIEIDATDQPGLYRVDWPDAAFAAGVPEVILTVKVATAFTEHLAVQIDPPVGTVTTLTGHTAQTGDSFARLAAPAGASVSADIAAVKTETALIVADTNELQTDDVPGLIAALNDISPAEVNTEVDNAIVTYRLDHLLAASASGADVANDSIIAQMVALGVPADWDTFSNATDSLQAMRDRGDAAWTTAVIATLLYSGPRGPGIYLDDAAANTNTVLGVDGIEGNPVSTIAAATTLAGSLGSNRIYLMNDSVITLAQTYEGWEFIGLGLSNQITLGSQDLDNTCFFRLNLTGVQGGTGLIWMDDCALTGLSGLECVAQRCYLTGTNTVRAASLILFDQCLSAVPGNATPELTFSGGASAVNFRHYSGGLQLNSMGTGDVVSFESDGQIVVDATCTDGLLTVRGCCDVTDNAGGNVTITQSAAINQANINAEVVDVMTVDTIAEQSQGAPPAAPTFAQVASYQNSLFRNKLTESPTEFKLFADDESTVLCKSTNSDAASLATKGEMVSGP